MPKKGGVPENLTPFKKGHVGIGGRPKGAISLTTHLQKLLATKIEVEDPLTHKKTKKLVGKALCEKLVTEALKGNMSAIKEVLNRAEGDPNKKLSTKSNLDDVDITKLTDEELHAIINNKF